MNGLNRNKIIDTEANQETMPQKRENDSRTTWLRPRAKNVGRSKALVTPRREEAN